MSVAVTGKVGNNQHTHMLGKQKNHVWVGKRKLQVVQGSKLQSTHKGCVWGRRRTR